MSTPGAVVQVTAEEARKARRAKYDPANLTEEGKTKLARRLAVDWVAGDKDSASTHFTERMVDYYGWTPEEVKTFLFTQSQRLQKIWRDLGDWSDGYGKITFDQDYIRR